MSKISKMSLKVFKFGGASVKDAKSIQNVAGILEKYKDESLLIVVSAMGKTTNALEEVTKAYYKKTGEAQKLMEEVKQSHYRMMAELFGTEKHDAFVEVNDIFVEADWVLEDEPEDSYDYIYDQIVSLGELVSTKILAAYLNGKGLATQWLDARDVILTDDIYREGWVQWDETQKRADRTAKPMLEAGGFVVTQGFIGSTTENTTTTLGREGSDYTAAIFSYCLDAESMSIWKDVPGVLTADPRLFDNVTKLDELSYREAIEMTYYGAKVIHPKTIKPLQNKSIPLFVKSFINPEGKGTMIAPDVEDNYPPMVAIENNQALLNISTRDFSFVAEQHISDLFNQITAHRLHVNMMQNTAISFRICVTDQDGKVQDFAKAIEDKFKVRIEPNLELITVRHYNKQTLNDLRADKVVLTENKIRKTVQMVVKTIPPMTRK